MLSMEVERTWVEMEERRQRMLAKLESRCATVKAVATSKDAQEADVDRLIGRAQRELAEGEICDETLRELELVLAVQHTGYAEKRLRETLVALRKKKQEGAMKTNFSFQKKIEKKEEKKEGTHDNYECANEIVKENDLEERVEGSEGATVDVSSLSGCRLSFHFHASTAHVKAVKDSTLVFLPLHTSALVSDCTRLTLVVAAQQVRVHGCRHLRLFVAVRGAVILEDCRDVLVGPYCVQGVNDFPQGDEWTRVKDFDFLGQGQSPNWRLLDSSQHETFSL